MDIQVKEVSFKEEKSVQEIEKELLEKHEQQHQEQNLPPDPTPDPVPSSEDELLEKEKDVLSYIGKRYNKEINSLDELFSAREQNEELPEDVASFLKYKKETGRGIQDFLKLQQDFDSMDENNLLREYFLQTEEGIDAEDVDAMLSEYSYDEELDDEADVKKARLAKKKALHKAKTYFNNLKEQYKQPLESSTVGIPDEEREMYQAYKESVEKAKTEREATQKKRDFFTKRTDELFSSEFKGFEFDLDGRKLVFAPGEAEALKKSQDSPMNFINKYLDENGMIKDAVGYHKALSMAMNPERYAKFFYEQGKADAVDGLDRKLKNVNMGERRAPESVNKGGMQVRVVNDDSGRGLRIRSVNKKQ